MAIGDLNIVMAANTADAGSVTRQPGSGVEELINEAGCATWEGSAPDGAPAISLTHFNGTLESVVEVGYSGNIVTAWFATSNRHIIDNTNYLRMWNFGGGTLDMSYSTIVVG